MARAAVAAGNRDPRAFTDPDRLDVRRPAGQAGHLGFAHGPHFTGGIDLAQLADLSEPDIRLRLTAIKGIGHWTADIYLMFCLQQKDIFPIGDIAVVNTVKELSAVQTVDEIRALAETWRPLRSLATYFLWHYYLRKRGR